MSCYCDYEPAQVFDKWSPKARKQLCCDECRGSIQAGERYERVRGLWAGRWEGYATCQRCLDIRQWVTNNIPCFCWSYTNMLEDAAECVSEAAWRVREETPGLRFGFLRLMAKSRQHRRAALASQEARND